MSFIFHTHDYNEQSPPVILVCREENEKQLSKFTAIPRCISLVIVIISTVLVPYWLNGEMNGRSAPYRYVSVGTLVGHRRTRLFDLLD